MGRGNAKGNKNAPKFKRRRIKRTQEQYERQQRATEEAAKVSALAERLQREIDETHAQLAVIAMDQEATLEDNECVVCMTSKKQYAFVPCGHVCVCEACAELIDKSTRECPMCCGACTQIMKTYL
mmetsp:Transcript_45800/g.67130  ORF Transcript_45800/g.67130 Transcript_45800/m.67130 type:complete len:125 (-) Transcript_45800:63-437(-)|eukprot:CAMPEP_0179430574 /NCGR_PEP_ID=MMETSP0799-20121207/15687_1 /TAXON_ID=46947 /ORGANISM="Geminigera cryophila, Strain CCMP2564" /LENGTH=124 /DNA_ID=CAMNT_0021207087 /DNA_START=431 /DNA_END=805 /DNA_ORIENTATION=-